MTIKPKILADWQQRCIDIERASEAINRNKDSIHRQKYSHARRYAVRGCVIEERRM